MALLLLCKKPVRYAFPALTVVQNCWQPYVRDKSQASVGYIARLERGPRLEGGIAEIIERSRVLTTSDDLNTAATSGSSTMATVPSDIFAANRFGFDLL